eukprot:scaffold125357_cov28-Tisochrysis_lutea.AAC.5
MWGGGGLVDCLGRWCGYVRKDPWWVRRAEREGGGGVESTPLDRLSERERGRGDGERERIGKKSEGGATRVVTWRDGPEERE